MTLDTTWLTREKWTLIEAALIAAGMEPYAGGASTDNPHDVLPRITNLAQRELFQELYTRSKDALGGALAIGERSRTGCIGNVRVRPFDYIRWVVDVLLPTRLIALIDRDVIKRVSGSPSDVPAHPTLTEDPYTESTLGYTIDGVAREVSLSHGVDEEALKAELCAAAEAGELQCINPKTGLPYRVLRRNIRTFADRFRTSDVEKWFSNKGANYTLRTQLLERGNQNRDGVTKDRIIAAFRFGSTADTNSRYWNYKLRKPPAWLKGARVFSGGRSVSGRWDPALVAYALLGRDGFTFSKLDRAMNDFPEYRDQWNAATENERP